MSMRAAQPLNPLIWLGVPAVVCVIASVVFVTPIRIFGVHLPQPVFMMVPAFAWGVIRPSVLAPFVLLALGVFLDALWGSSIGLWPSCLLVAYASVLAARNLMSGQSPPIMWAWYAGVTLLAMAAGYFFTLLDMGAAPALGPVLWQAGWTAILYPFAHRLIDRYEDADVRFK